MKLTKICKDIPIKKTCQYNYKIKAIQLINFEDTTQEKGMTLFLNLAKLVIHVI